LSVRDIQKISGVYKEKELDAMNNLFASCFSYLNMSRKFGGMGGELPIPLTEYRAYEELFDDTIGPYFINILVAMDAAYMKACRENRGK